MLSGSASRHTSVTDSFDRESFNSVEQTFTVVVVSFMVALIAFTEPVTLSCSVPSVVGLRVLCDSCLGYIQV